MWALLGVGVFAGGEGRRQRADFTGDESSAVVGATEGSQRSHRAQNGAECSAVNTLNS